MIELTPLEHGVLGSSPSKETIRKLKNNAGVVTVNDLARETPKALSDRADIGQDTAEKAINAALKYLDLGFKTGDQLHSEMELRTRLTTGSKSVDTLLGGGIESNTTTEISGRNGSGKTQVCHMLAITTQLPLSEGGLEGKVVWVDTEDTFRPDRIKEICDNRGYDVDAMLRGIFHGKALTSQHQKQLVEELNELVNTNNIKLIIVDSMMAHLRAEYVGRGMLGARQNVLNSILHRLHKICETHGVTAIYTNQVMDNPGQLYGNPEKAIGGHIMGHAATTRLEIRKGRLTSRVIKLTKSPYLAEGEATFVINEMGVDDMEKKKDEDKTHE